MEPTTDRLPAQEETAAPLEVRRWPTERPLYGLVVLASAGFRLLCALTVSGLVRLVLTAR